MIIEALTKYLYADIWTISRESERLVSSQVLDFSFIISSMALNSNNFFAINDSVKNIQRRNAARKLQVCFSRNLIIFIKLIRFVMDYVTFQVPNL